MIKSLKKTTTTTFIRCSLLIFLNSYTAFNTKANTQVASGLVYSVIDIVFSGPRFEANQSPFKEVDFWVLFRHESGSPSYKIHGFWDGDGKGGASGGVFKIRFCPTLTGRWNILQVFSYEKELHHQKEGDYVTATKSNHHGFWLKDDSSAGARWFKRSDNSHQYIYGNTHYSFLSETYLDKPNGSDIAKDVKGNAVYYKKLRFSAISDRYPHPTDKPFLSKSGEPTDSGDNSHRPNPKWFSQRTDLAVKTAYDQDLIADILIGGVDLESSRSSLRASNNNGDPTPYLKYIVARYGAYPNVWFCIVNEWDIKELPFKADQIKNFAKIIRSFMAYPNPLSVHSSSKKVNYIWPVSLNNNPAWNSHVINQAKLKKISSAADNAEASYIAGGANKPAINDELGYQGEGDKFSEADVIEGHLGVFIGGGYGSTSHKSGNKLGQYFAGNFNAETHSASDNLLWLRQNIDQNITFWRMAPIVINKSIFDAANKSFKAMQWEEQEYVLATDTSGEITAKLPAGKWEVTRFEAISKVKTNLSSTASGSFKFEAPASRAVLFLFKKR